MTEHCAGARQVDVTTLDQARRRLLCNGCGTVYLEPLVIEFRAASPIGAQATQPRVPTADELLHAALPDGLLDKITR